MQSSLKNNNKGDYCVVLCKNSDFFDGYSSYSAYSAHRYEIFWRTKTGCYMDNRNYGAIFYRRSFDKKVAKMGEQKKFLK